MINGQYLPAFESVFVSAFASIPPKWLQTAFQCALQGKKRQSPSGSKAA
jgi:hypothetical protein